MGWVGGEGGGGFLICFARLLHFCAIKSSGYVLFALCLSLSMLEFLLVCSTTRVLLPCPVCESCVVAVPTHFRHHEKEQQP